MKKNLDKVKVKITNARNIEDDLILDRLIKKTILKVPKNGRRLNKLRNQKPLDPVKVERLMKRSEHDGYFSLQSFAYCHRDTIKISYLTLYRRMINNRDVLNTLMSRKIVDMYHFDVKREGAVIKTRFKIFKDKEQVFIDFILDKFLTDSQK